VFLKELKKNFRRQYVILIWDGLPAHKSRKMTEYLQSQQEWLRVERLPGYAPDLNPVESLWGNIKGKELANRSADDLSEVADALRIGFDRVFGQRSLLLGKIPRRGGFVISQQVFERLDKKTQGEYRQHTPPAVYVAV